MGGFECSTHRLPSGRRLDVVRASRHDEFVVEDYQRLKSQDILTCREGLRWHLIETRPYEYDFSSALPMIRASETLGIQVLWDLFHYGWPDDLDIFSPEFIERFAAFARAFAELLASESSQTPYICPVNEISFFAWAGGDCCILNPFTPGRADELKRQMVRASLAATHALWEVNPRTRLVQIDPVINIIADPDRPQDREMVEGFRLGQYEAWDMLGGRRNPELGGAPKYLDLIGINYYDRNQWVHNQEPLFYTDPLYRPFREIIREVYERYGRPIFIAETGTEDDFRPEWFRYVVSEVCAAIAEGIPVEGICLYPILNHPGWVDDRHCHNGLWDYADDQGNRALYQPLADELQNQRAIVAQVRTGLHWHESPPVGAGEEDTMPV